MPDLSEELVCDLESRLKKILGIASSDSIHFLNSGGSAAVFRVNTTQGLRAYKIFDPKFLSGASGEAERRRLELQRKLIGHNCPTLVQAYQVEEKCDTAYIEMEFISWPQLNKVLHLIPDEAVGPLFKQLVDAVKFLDSLDIVHRDIKPENIHVSDDYKSLKLLDLGVARFIENDRGESRVTDQGHQRPFLATAQYSSPEYLFRLDDPSPTIWKGLNFYQLGGVLHDMVMKVPLFNEEISRGNRWLVASAVLTKMPSFNDEVPNRLVKYKALARRCLTKDVNIRLRLVSWSDFDLDELLNSKELLRKRLSQAGHDAEIISEAEDDALKHDRRLSQNRIIEMVRDDLISICSPVMHIKTNDLADRSMAVFDITKSGGVHVRIIVAFDWLESLNAKQARVFLSAVLLGTSQGENLPELKEMDISNFEIENDEGLVADEVVNGISSLIALALDVIESGSNKDQSQGLDLIGLAEEGE